VAFESDASNLDAADVNGLSDVFVYDRQTGTTQRVSIGAAGESGTGHSMCSAISPDGRYVAFKSAAPNLVADDTNEESDIFLRDLESGSTEVVSVGMAGEQSNGFSDRPAVSAYAGTIAFESMASNLVTDDTNTGYDVFARDRQCGPFADVPCEHWAADEIDVCAQAGIVEGHPDGLYYPDWTVTRDQMAVYMCRAMSGPTATPTSPAIPTFPDVPSDSWAHVEV
jgi:hypothetical protein